MCQIPVNLENNRLWDKIIPKKFEWKKILKTQILIVIVI